MIATFFERGAWYLCRTDPAAGPHLAADAAAAVPRLQARTAPDLPQTVRQQHAVLLPAAATPPRMSAPPPRPSPTWPARRPPAPHTCEHAQGCSATVCAFRTAPPSASGRSRHDLLLGLTGVAVNGMFAAAAAMRRPSAPAERDRTLSLTVVDRRVVAHDQNVVALTLTAAGRFGAAGLASGRASGHPPAQRPDPAVLAVRRTRPAHRLPHRGAANPRRRRRIDRGARRAAGGCLGDHQRTPKRLPAELFPVTARPPLGCVSSPAASGSPRSCRCSDSPTDSVSTGR